MHRLFEVIKSENILPKPPISECSSSEIIVLDFFINDKSFLFSMDAILANV